jgi:hypothetical protein
MLHEKFNDPVKAVCYMGTGLTCDFPDGVLEVTFRAGSRMRLFTSSIRDVVKHLERLCKKFPRSSVYYDPDASDRIVGEIRCHCEENIRLQCCSHGEDRPRVLVRLVRAGRDEPLFEATPIESAEDLRDR